LLLANWHSSHVIEWCAAVLIDECRWIEPAARFISIARADKRRHKFAHFKMEVGKVEAIRGPDRRDLLTNLPIGFSSFEHSDLVLSFFW
jgi:hypothetical protein